MKPTELSTESFDRLQRDLRARAVPFAVATVVRTLDATSAKPGSKAILSSDGEILEGWVGGGCARGAISRAAKTAIARSEPVLVALRPDEALEAEGVEPCEVRDGMIYERNGCASKGSLDIYVEAFVPAPELVVIGDGPVAKALRDLGRGFDFRLSDALPRDVATRDCSGYFVVVATQGRGDAAALETGVKANPRYLAFVGSRKKAAALRDKLADKGLSADALDRIVAPAGLDIRAATPEEIALSILAEIVGIRRAGA